MTNFPKTKLTLTGNWTPSELQLIKLQQDVSYLRQLVIEAEEIISNPAKDDGLDMQIWRQRASVCFDD